MESPNTSSQALTQAAGDRAHPNRHGTSPGHKNTEPGSIFYSTPHSIYDFSTQKRGCQVREGCPKEFRAAGTNGRIDLSLTWQTPEDPLKRPYKIWSGSWDQRWAKESVVPIRRSSAGWMPESMGGGPLEWDANIQWLCARRCSRHCLWDECERCDTRLVRSTQLLSRPKIKRLCSHQCSHTTTQLLIYPRIDSQESS